MDDFHSQSVGDARINARPPRNLTLHALQLEGEDRARLPHRIGIKSWLAALRVLGCQRNRRTVIKLARR